MQRNLYLKMLDEAFNQLSIDYKLGINVNHIRQGYFKYKIGKHLIFYRLQDGDVEVVRILHQKMDIEAHI
ncbi:MAG: type II toxin-antitoxin system RelE/ParE family toxin [Spirochaetaceae bacterium]|nr:type II toxin-antitoxin system RelE/ParE family toxin [Spirochaetaceae bacterium]